MRVFYLFILLSLLSTQISAQDFGFSVTRGACFIQPQTAGLLKSRNHAVSYGFFGLKRIRSGTHLNVGTYMDILWSNKWVQNASNDWIAIPKKYNYLNVPISFEQRLLAVSRQGYKPVSYYLQCGITASYLFHEQGWRPGLSDAQEINPFNLGANLAILYHLKLDTHHIFSFGPEVKMFNTREEVVKKCYLAGLKFEYRYNSSDNYSRKI